ncbi:MAG: hypothetical protein DHS20C11_30160 [Lysobacteraceae bacterium]|nr:MAG: hypothetical protein DHS20C11_30160 [Xanthomonadaceae bacterium]
MNGLLLTIAVFFNIAVGPVCDSMGEQKLLTAPVERVCEFSPGQIHQFAVELQGAAAVVLRRNGNQPSLQVEGSETHLSLGTWGGEEGEIRALLQPGSYALTVKPVEDSFPAATYSLSIIDVSGWPQGAVDATKHFGSGLDRHYRHFRGEGGSLVAAREHLSMAHAKWRAVEDDHGTAIAAYELANVEWGLGNTGEAWTLFDQAASIWSGLGDARSAMALNLRGLLEWRAGDLDQAELTFKQVLDERLRLGRGGLIGQVLNNQALVAVDRGDYRAARDRFETAISYFTDEVSAERTGWATEQASRAIVLDALASSRLNYVLPMVNNLGLALDALGDPGAAAAMWLFYLQHAPSVADRAAVAMAYQNLGNNYFHRGQFDLALQNLNEARQRFAGLENAYGLGYAEHNLGRLHASWGRDDLAELHFESALKNRSEDKYTLRRSETLLEYARLNARNGDVEGASKRIERAIALADAAGLEAVMVKALAARARLAIIDNDYTKALEAVESAMTSGAPKASVRVLAALQLAKGQALIGLGQYAEAARELQLSGQRFEASWMAIEEAQANIALATAYRRNGEFGPAADAATVAIESIERGRQHVMSPTSRAEYFSSLRHAYFERASAEIGLGNEEQAWRIAQDSRSRSFNDQLALERSVLQSAAAVALRERLNAKANALQETSEDTVEHDALVNELAAISREWDDFLAEHMREISQTTDALSADPMYWINSLGDDEAIVEFLLADDEGLAFEVSGVGIATRSIAGSKQLSILVSRVNESLISGGRLDGSAARDLSEKLFENVGLSAATLLLIPDGVLNNVPFALLPDPATKYRSPLVSQRALAVASAVTHFRQGRGEGNGWNSIAVAAAPLAETALPVQQTAAVFRSSLELTPLRYAVEEARMIESLPFDGPPIVVTGSEANRTAITSDQFAAVDILHFATHAVSNHLVPEASGILLAGDGDETWDFLRLLDIQSSRIAAELVVLSACETGTGKLVDGEGALSLARAFQLAGAGGVVSSLWRVDDRATLRFMEFFYQALIVDELAPAHALRFAQLELMKSAEMRNPFYWAAFTYQGNPFGH